MRTSKRLLFDQYGNFFAGPNPNSQFSCPHGNGIWYDALPSYSWGGEPKHYRNKYEYPYSYDSFYIFGDPDSTKGSFGDYTDRMFQWAASDNKYNRKLEMGKAAIKAMRKGGNWRWDNITFEELDAFVKAYYGKGYKATGLVESCNQSSGYMVWYVMYKGPRKRKKPA